MALCRSGLAWPGQSMKLFSTAAASSFIRLKSRTRDGGAADQEGRRGLGGDGGGVGGGVGRDRGGRKRKWERWRWLGRTGEGSTVTHRPHCQLNAIGLFYWCHCSHWHFQCTSHTLSLSITHSLHFLGQPAEADIISHGCVGRKIPCKMELLLPRRRKSEAATIKTTTRRVDLGV